MVDPGLACVSFDPVRYPGAMVAAETALGAALPDFGRLRQGGSRMLRSAPCEWFVLVPRPEAAALVARLAALLSPFPAIVSDVSDGYRLIEGIDPKRLGALSSVELANGEARALRLRQIRVLAFVCDGWATVIVPRSYGGIPGLGQEA